MRAGVDGQRWKMERKAEGVGRGVKGKGDKDEEEEKEEEEGGSFQ